MRSGPVAGLGHDGFVGQLDFGHHFVVGQVGEPAMIEGVVADLVAFQKSAFHQPWRIGKPLANDEESSVHPFVGENVEQARS